MHALHALSWSPFAAVAPSPVVAQNQDVDWEQMGLFSVLCSVHLTHSDSLLPACFGRIPRMLSLGRTNEGRNGPPRQERGNWIPPCGSGVGRVGCNVSFGRRGRSSLLIKLCECCREPESALRHSDVGPWSSVWFVRSSRKTLEKRKWSIWISFWVRFRTELREPRPPLRFPPRNLTSNLAAYHVTERYQRKEPQSNRPATFSS